MKVVILLPTPVSGTMRRPGEVVAVPEEVGASLISSGMAREQRAAGPAETKSNGDPEPPDEPDDDEGEPDGGREPDTGEGAGAAR